MIFDSYNGAHVSFEYSLFECVKKLKKQGVVCHDNEKISVICCSNRAKHELMKKSDCDVIMSSLCIFSNSSVQENDRLPSNPNNVFSFIQAQAKENIQYLKQIMAPYFQDE